MKSCVSPNLPAAKVRLAEGLEELKRRHRAGCSGVQLCVAVADLRDEVLRGLFHTALADLGEAKADALGSHVALVAHGGYGRRDVAPYSDVDLMILHAPAASSAVAPLAERLLRDVFDVGLTSGHSVRTPEQACRLAVGDPSICTSLMESRLLAGDRGLFDHFARRFRRQVQQRARTLMGAIERARREEQIRYGETVFLLEPNVKRSRGALRALQFLRWIGFARYATAEPDQLRAQGVLSEQDFQVLAGAGEFLLRLRNEMHFHAGRAADVLSRAEQLRIAEVFGYRPAEALLPVEQFMRDYFRHTSQLSHVVQRFATRARSRDRVARWVTAALGHRVEGGVRVGPAGLMATREGLEPLRGNLTEIMRLVALANLYDKPIAPPTWEVVRLEASRLPDVLPPEARHRFVSLLSHSGRLGPLLRDLHAEAILQRFIPEFAHARGLLQFNQYHKYTVDEHCLRAVECATELASAKGPLGDAYRRTGRKHVLHLALLIHDLGKGHAEDHVRLGTKIAEGAAERLGLPPREAEALKFLVRHHNLMNHLAFRRDTSDEQLVVRFAVQVGSPELLRMLYVMTAADLGAVGPGVWDGWKDEIITDLYLRTMQQLAGESPAAVLDEQLRRRRESVGERLGSRRRDPWFSRQLDALPAGYLVATDAEQVAADLRLLHEMGSGKAVAEARYLAETETLQLTVGTREDITPGVFHKLTGALTGQGLRIRSAAINTLADGYVLDRFSVYDPDFAGKPPPDRIEAIKEALVQSLRDGGQRPPAFRRTWQHDREDRPAGRDLHARVNADNSTSKRYTILDIFAVDRPGLLYAVTRTLFELGLSVWRAKIGTYLDQVVDVFYVTDRDDQKIEDEPRLEEIRRRLLEVIESGEN